MMKKTVIILISVVLIAAHAIAQQTPLPLFKKGDRVCFVGNSITHAGDFHHNILLYYIARFPQAPVSFYNCGVAGDETSQIISRLDSDVLVHQPTHAVLMAGMNDIHRWLYGPTITKNADTLQQQRQALTDYKANLEKLINLLQNKHIQVIMERPTPYDQTAQLPEKNYLGCNDALQVCARIIDTLAQKYHLPTVDYFSAMNAINQREQAKDPAFTITGPDRVHPGAAGHLVMSYTFLQTSGAQQYVAKIIPGGQSENCSISNLKQSGSGMEFTCMENALPFPLGDVQQLIPFNNDLNVELLQTKGLSQGNYKLTIDGTEAGTFTNMQLEGGVNLTSISSTPQIQQALRVKAVLDSLWATEVKLRDMMFVQTNFIDNFPHRSNPALVKLRVDSLLKAHPGDEFFESVLGNYIATHSARKKYEAQMAMWRKEAYLLAQPHEHVYTLTRQN